MENNLVVLFAVAGLTLFILGIILASALRNSTRDGNLSEDERLRRRNRARFVAALTETKRQRSKGPSK